MGNMEPECWHHFEHVAQHSTTAPMCYSLKALLWTLTLGYSHATDGNVSLLVIHHLTEQNEKSQLLNVFAMKAGPDVHTWKNQWSGKPVWVLSATGGAAALAVTSTPDFRPDAPAPPAPSNLSFLPDAPFFPPGFSSAAPAFLPVVPAFPPPFILSYTSFGWSSSFSSCWPYFSSCFLGLNP